MKNRILAAVLAGIIAAASAATLAGCGKSNDKSSKISTTIKPMGTTAATTVPGTTSATGSTVAIQDENGNILSTLPPNENAQQPSGNSVTDAALSYFGVSSANGYSSSVYNTYTTASGANYYLVVVTDSKGIVTGMVWVSEDGSATFDTEAFYSTYIKPELNNGDNSDNSGEQATYWISPKGPDHAEAGDSSDSDTNYVDQNGYDDGYDDGYDYDNDNDYDYNYDNDYDNDEYNVVEPFDE